MRVLFVKHSLGWPRSTGHDVYCFHMMKAVSELGAEVSLATVLEPDRHATDGISLFSRDVLSGHAEAGSHQAMKLTRVQERYRSYYGIDRNHIESLRNIAATSRADVVIAFGLEALPFLAGVDNALRVWAMADEWVYHHLSQVRVTDVKSWVNLKTALVKGVYERAYQPVVDRVWVVSETDRWAARWFAGMHVTDLLPNGVDTEFYRPTDEIEAPASAVFWGRLNFSPNIDALRWFCREIWPGITSEVPEARFTIIGYQPTREVECLTQVPGVSLVPDLADLRSAVCQNAVVVLPFTFAGGIKNKLLEGAALARPIVCTPHACKDLHSHGPLPLVIAANPDDWRRSVVTLWKDAKRRAELGNRAREWVIEHYSWSAPGRNALKAFERGCASIAVRPGLDGRAGVDTRARRTATQTIR